MKTIELSVEKRSTTGKGEARRVRASGRIPGVVYGASKPNVPISLDRKPWPPCSRGHRKSSPEAPDRPEPPLTLARDPVPANLHSTSCVSDGAQITVEVPIEVAGVARGVKTAAEFWPRDPRVEVSACRQHARPTSRGVSPWASATRSACRTCRRPGVRSWTPRAGIVPLAHPTGEEEPAPPRRGRRRAGRARGPEEGQGRHRGGKETRPQKRRRQGNASARDRRPRNRDTTEHPYN